MDLRGYVKFNLMLNSMVSKTTQTSHHLNFDHRLPKFRIASDLNSIFVNM